MATVTFDVPEGALSALRLSPTEFVKEMRVAAALLWYSQGEISQSKGVERLAPKIIVRPLIAPVEMDNRLRIHLEVAGAPDQSFEAPFWLGGHDAEALAAAFDFDRRARVEHLVQDPVDVVAQP